MIYATGAALLVALAVYGFEYSIRIGPERRRQEKRRRRGLK